MFRCRDQYRIERNHRLEFEIRWNIEQRTYAEIDSTVAKLLESVHTRDIVQNDGDARMDFCEFLYRRWENVLNRRFTGRNREAPLLDLVPARFKISIYFDKS